MTESKLVSHDYFLNKMQLWEIYFLSNEIPYSFQTSWEQTRLISFFICQKWVKKRLKLKDIFTLPGEVDNTHYRDLTDEELEQNKQLQKQIENMLNNNQEINNKIDIQTI